jgi:hypothetical protein
MTTPARQPQHCEHYGVCYYVKHRKENLISDCYLCINDDPYLKDTPCAKDTRPHTSPPAQIPNPFSVITDEGFEGVVKAIQETAAKTAREDALNEFMMAIEYRFEDTNNGRGVVGTIRGLKESLRAQQEPQQEGRR